MSMAYEKHIFVDGETVLTKQILDEMEEGIANYQKGEKGDTGEKGEKGDPGEKGEKGDTGEGLTGEAAAVTALESDAELTEVVAKVNEIITQLKARGIVL